MGLNESCGLKH